MNTLIEVECPHCHARLWVDTEAQEVVKHEKSEKKTHSSFEDLLSREKQKKEKVEERFSQAKSLEAAKKKKAEELFSQSLKEKE
jgi:hypothetical protein